MSRFVALMYHKLHDSPRGHYTITHGDFRSQLAWLKAEGFTIEGFRELDQRLGRNDTPAKYVVMSFDDGHKSDLRAAELVREAGGQATFFLTKSLCGSRSSFLNVQEVKELATLGSVGTHGVTHNPLSGMSAERMRSELSESKQWLEDLLGESVYTFSAPGGYITERVADTAFELGYRILGNSKEWCNDSSRVAATRVVNRIAIRNSFSSAIFPDIASGATTFLLKRRLRAGLLLIPKKVMELTQLVA
jgi:peptidoglycan/xylan/chitin deacetylase (PgdA/CDA1 family)